MRPIYPESARELRAQRSESGVDYAGITYIRLPTTTFVYLAAILDNVFPAVHWLGALAVDRYAADPDTRSTALIRPRCPMPGFIHHSDPGRARYAAGNTSLILAGSRHRRQHVGNRQSIRATPRQASSRRWLARRCTWGVSGYSSEANLNGYRSGVQHEAAAFRFRLSAASSRVRGGTNPRNAEKLTSATNVR